MNLKQYLVITGNYWGFTLTDGALRMLVVLYFHQLGYAPLTIAMLFLFYEFFGVVTNLLGGYLGARIGLNRTMHIGLGLQIVALVALTVPEHMLTVAWVMAAQAVSGIAKDLNKMSAKSAIKLFVAEGEQQRLYKWVAALTGSKNALKGVGFFLGGFLLTVAGFQGALWIMIVGLVAINICSYLLLQSELGIAKVKPKFKDIFSKSHAINMLSAARLFLFGARDVWFVVALPVYLSQQFNWDHWQVGGFLASWVIFYGLVQALAPRFTGRSSSDSGPGRSAALGWVAALMLVPAGIAVALMLQLTPQYVIVVGLLIFAFIFAVNSSLHSYLIVHYASADGVSLDVGFYYMANAMGRLIGTVLSGLIFQYAGLVACLWFSSGFLVLTLVFTRLLREQSGVRPGA